MVFFAIWYAAGLLGAWLIFDQDYRFDRHLMGLFPLSGRQAHYCPTPLRIVSSALLSLGGPALLCVGLICFAVTQAEIFRDGPKGWWRTPICK